MKILYFDQISGISGDMILSALYDIIGPEGKKFIPLLPLKNNVKNSIKFKNVVKNHICAKKFFVLEENNEIKYFELLNLVKKSKFSDKVKDNVLKTLKLISETEAKIHNVSIKNFHFHNYNDLLVELFGTYYILENLSVEKIYSSTIKLNQGFVNCVHGKFPVPAPATLELSKGTPVEYIDFKSENSVNIETTTPTGVAILKVLSPEFVFPNNIEILKIGYAAGEYDFDFPNVLRVILGKKTDGEIFYMNKYQKDKVIKIETNIDDLNPVFYESLVEKLYNIGCYEVNLINTVNKKLRNGVLVSIILDKSLIDKVVKILFENTTTTGLRIEEISRIKLFRENRVIKTKFGKVNVKIVTLPNGKKDFRPEYDDVKNISYKTDIPLPELYHKILSELNKCKQ